MATRSMSKHHKENEELWDLLRRCRSRLAIEGNATARPRCTHDLQRNDGILHAEESEGLMKNYSQRLTFYSGQARTIQEWKGADDTTPSVKRKVFRDYQREHSEVLYLIKRSKERLSKNNFSKIESLLDSRSCLDDDGTIINRNSSHFPGAFHEVGSTSSKSLRKQGIGKGNALMVCDGASDSLTAATMESILDNSFDNFSYNEDLDRDDDCQLQCDFFGFAFKLFRRKRPAFVTIL